jgi:hypothetical protein
MKTVVFLLSVLALSSVAHAEFESSDHDGIKRPKEVKEVEQVEKANPHKNLHLYFLDRRPYIAPKHDKHNTNSTV